MCGLDEKKKKLFFLRLRCCCCFNFLKTSETLKKIVPLLSGPAARETVFNTYMSRISIC